MRLCRYQHKGKVEIGIYEDDRIIAVNKAAKALGIRIPTPDSISLLDYLAPLGKSAKAVQQVQKRFPKLTSAEQRRLSQPREKARLLAPIANPSKVICLAGNYGAHIVEGGGVAPERSTTFPYFFW